jgi:hypothetical protein
VLTLRGSSSPFFRNKLTHEYDRVDDALVWGVIKNNLPTLLKQCTQPKQKPPLKTCSARSSAVSGRQATGAITGRRKLPWRYRWPDSVRDDVLARLLALNAER